MDLENQTILAILTDFPLNAIHPPGQIYEDDKFICFHKTIFMFVTVWTNYEICKAIVCNMEQ